MADIFTSVEFYIIAFAVAAIIAAFFGFDNTPPEATSEIYSPHTIAPGSGEDPSVTISSNEDGSIEVVRHNISIPQQNSIYIKADFVKDRITLTERTCYDPAGNNTTTGTACDVHFTIRRRPPKKYFIRYECAGSSLWGTAHFANYGNYSTRLQLRT